MRTFLSLLKEEADESKLKHITHVEDHVLHDGADGFKHAVGVLNQVQAHIKAGKQDPTLAMKHDGSPSIVYGHHPETGKFFVASKSAFNATPKINYTPQDVEKNHGHAPGLVSKLQDALKHLPKVAPSKGIYQGDMMFGHGDKTENDGKVHFKPNTINYSAPKDSEEGKKIKKAKLGLYTHTEYRDPDGGRVKSFDTMKAHFDPDLTGFKSHSDVYHRTPGHDTSKTYMSAHDDKQLTHHLDAAHAIDKLHGKKMYDGTELHRNAGGPIESHINATVRTGETPSVEGLKKHLSDKLNKDISKLKTPAAQSRKEAERDAHIAHIDNNTQHYENLLKLHHHVQKAKDVLVHVLARHTGGLEHTVGDAQVKPEGFVATHKGRVSKLNDRQEFNRLNFLSRPR